MTPLSGRSTQTKYAKLQLWRTFNLNKTQSINDALRAVYGGRGGNFVALGGGVRNQPYLLFPHTYGLEKQPVLKYFENTWAWPNNKVTQHIE